jgi:hypothetical protein
MELMLGGFGDLAFSAAVQQLMDLPDELKRQLNAPTRAYVRDRWTMANTPMDVKELPSWLSTCPGSASPTSRPKWRRATCSPSAASASAPPGDLSAIGEPTGPYRSPRG